MTKNKRFNLNKFYSKIYRRYDLINKLFTFGLDRKWRKITIEACLEGKPKKVLDLCTGTGDLAISIAKTSKDPISIIGYDMNISMLDQAKRKSQKINKFPPEFIQGNAASMPFEKNMFERITIGFGFRNLTFNNSNETQHISEIYRVLKPEGKLLILESAVPANSVIRFFYKIHLYLFLIPIGGILSGDFKAYWYLAHSSSKYYTDNEMKELLSEHKFSKIEIRKFFLGASNLIIAQK